MKTLQYDLDLRAVRSGMEGDFCWVQARGGLIPRRAASPTIIVTMQRLLLSGSDVFYGPQLMRSDDGGATWTGPFEQAGLERFKRDDGGEGVVCDFNPAWHAATGRLLGTGQTAMYLNNRLMPAPRPRQTAYAVFDESSGQFTPWRALELPGEEFFSSGAGSVQRLDLPDGDILLPVYSRSRQQDIDARPYRVQVLRCGFDGERMTVKDIGPALELAEGRGLYEPSIAQFGGRYYLTMRATQRAFVAVSDDGMNFSPPQPWTFDDGSDLGSYETQAHWVTRPDGLLLVYTRRGLDNDHVFRHRAPLVMGQVDPARLCVVRDTERVIVPERGARLGNFAIGQGDGETWVFAAEWMQNGGVWAKTMLEKLGRRKPEDPWTPRSSQHYAAECQAFGADNTVWACHIRWR